MNRYKLTRAIAKQIGILIFCWIAYRNEPFETYLAAVFALIAVTSVIPDCIAHMFSRKYRYDGKLLMSKKGDKDLYSFVVNTPFYELPLRDELYIEVVKSDEKVMPYNEGGD